MAMPRSNDYSRKLHPYLRVIADGDQSVNAVRSDGSVRVASSIPVDDKGQQVAPIHEELAQQAAYLPRWTTNVAVPPMPSRARKRRKPPAATDAFVNVFIEFFPERLDEPAGQNAITRLEKRIKTLRGSTGPVETQEVARRNILSATVPVAAVTELAEDPAVAFIHPSEPLAMDRPVVTVAPPSKEPASKAVGDPAVIGRGEGVLIGIIDVNGFDFAHPDFLDDKGRTRFVAIWDQGGDFRKPPKGFTRGSEFRANHLNAAIKAAGKGGLPPAVFIERQSQMQAGSHGTHVASIAAGNSGVCPKAKIAAVLLDVPAVDDDVERRRSTFSDSSSIVEAVEYLLGIARELKMPLSINISLGTNGGSHDGSGAVSRWIDALLAEPGRSVCVAAGNAGQDKAKAEGDLGWVMGRIHTSGRVAARGLEAEIEWTVIGDGIEDWSENELEIWYGAQDRFTVSVKPPGVTEWVTVGPREYVENKTLRSGVRLSIYNEIYHPTTGGNYISVYLSPDFNPDKFRGIPKGIWRVRLRGEEVRNGTFDAWIERDDPMEIERRGERRLFRFPSFFTERTNVDSHSITSLACGHRVIAVANLDEAREQINVTSSQGPTRDGRFKPEIAAPGTDVYAANGFATDGQTWIGMSGTSMASPYIAGVVGLMLDAGDSLTAAQCIGILQRTARPLAGASYEWVNDLGFGRIDPVAAVQEAGTINKRVEIG